MSCLPAPPALIQGPLELLRSHANFTNGSHCPFLYLKEMYTKPHLQIYKGLFYTRPLKMSRQLQWVPTCKGYPSPTFQTKTSTMPTWSGTLRPSPHQMPGDCLSSDRNQLRDLFAFSYQESCFAPELAAHAAHDPGIPLPFCPGNLGEAAFSSLTLN